MIWLYAKVIAIPVALLLFFVAFATYIDELSGVKTSGVFAEGIDIDRGLELFWGKGQCHTCHKVGSKGSATRGPNLENLWMKASVERANQRSSQTGKEYDGYSYLFESLTDPGIYLVEGFPKEMPIIYQPPVALSEDEILSVVAYLVSLEEDPDMAALAAYKGRIPSAAELPAEAFKPIFTGNAKDGEALFFADKAICAKCHTAVREFTLATWGEDVSLDFDEEKKIVSITAVKQGSDAEKSGLKPRDQMVSFAGVAVDSVETITRAAAKLDKPFAVRIKRGAQVGPDLSDLGARQMTPVMIESILYPSKQIVIGYKEMIVLLEAGLDVRGTPTGWEPDEKQPQTLRISVLEGGELTEKKIDLEDVTTLGDTVVGVERDGDLLDLCGLYVAGDEKSGITLRILKEDGEWAEKDGGWVEKKFTPKQLEFVNLPISPMPEDFASKLTVKEIFDIVAYLETQK